MEHRVCLSSFKKETALDSRPALRSQSCLQWQSVWIPLQQLYSFSLVVVSVYDLSNDEAVKVAELVQVPQGPQGQRVTKGEENPY